MACKDDFCEIDEKKVKKCCGVEPVVKINFLSAWIRCPECGRCVTTGSIKEARRIWNSK